MELYFTRNAEENDIKFSKKRLIYLCHEKMQLFLMRPNNRYIFKEIQPESLFAANKSFYLIYSLIHSYFFSSSFCFFFLYLFLLFANRNKKNSSLKQYNKTCTHATIHFRCLSIGMVCVVCVVFFCAFCYDVVDHFNTVLLPLSFVFVRQTNQ